MPEAGYPQIPRAQPQKTVSDFHNATMQHMRQSLKNPESRGNPLHLFLSILRALRARENIGLRKPFCRRLR
ncbi:MAG: hypothetical protein J6J65_06800 [Opitutales bacterium]|nr:hypothetical protein [Opitutales bacterium]